MPAQRIAVAVRQRRRDLSLTQAELAQNANVSLKVVKSLEGGQTQLERMTEQLRNVEQALGWGPGSLASIAQARPPILLDGPETDPEALESRLPVKVVEALEQDVVDYEFIETDVDGVRQILVTVRDPSRAPLTRSERKSLLARVLMRKTEGLGG